MKSNNRLPSEFLHQVSTYLSLQDRYNCLFVCRFWYHAFSRIIYKTIHVYSDTQFKQFIHSLSHNGHFVKSLCLHSSAQYSHEPIDSLEDLEDPRYVKPININQEQLELLNVLCPQLEIFEFDRSQWKHLQLTKQMKLWKHMIRCAPIEHSTFLDSRFISIFGSSLTYLNINYTHVPEQEADLISSLHLVPTLKHLALETFFNDTQQPMTTSIVSISKFLEQIHTELPYLQKLEFIRTNPPKHEPLTSVHNDSNLLSNFTKASQLKSLTVQGYIDSIRWFEFIQNNYPHLEELKINQIATSRFGTKWMWQQALVNLIRQSRCMKSLSIGGRNTPQLLSTGLALELKSPACPIEELYIDFKTYQAIESCQFLLIIVAYGLRQLRFLRLRVWEQTPGWSGVTHNLFQCRQLVSLELSLSKGLMDQYPFTPFLIDNFLENMPQLEQLFLVGAEIQVLYNHLVDLNTQFSFSLHTLTLAQSRVQNHHTVFPYLSACCPHLKQVHFKQCEVTKPSLAFSVNLLSSHLEKISLCSFLLGATTAVEYIGIKLITHSPASRKMAWCHVAFVSPAYPEYTMVKDQDVLDELDSLQYQTMPGNYAPSLGIITLRCQSVSDIYLDTMKISRKHFIMIDQ